MTGWLDASSGHCGPKAAYGDFKIEVHTTNPPIRRRLAFIRELERRLKEQTAELEVLKPVRKAA